MKNQYKKSKVKGISLSKDGGVMNSKTGKVLSITKRGNFIYKERAYNLAKEMLHTFRNIPVKTGQITHLDGNRSNFHIENIQYRSKIPKLARPTEPELLELIHTYFDLPSKFTIKDAFSFRLYLSIIADKLAFFIQHKNSPYIEVFRDYVDIHYPSIQKLSKKHNLTVLDTGNIVSGFLWQMIDEVHRRKAMSTIERIRIKKSKNDKQSLRDYENFLVKSNLKK